MTWFYFAILGNLLLTFSILFAKLVVSETETHKTPLRPIIFTFYTSILMASGFLILLPLSLYFRVLSFGIQPISFGILTAWFILAGLFLLYLVAREEEISRIGTVLWGLIPFFVFVFARSYLKEVLNFWQIIALILLISGSLIVHRWRSKLEFKLSKNSKPLALPVFLVLVPCSLAFAIGNTLLKKTFDLQGQTGYFFWEFKNNLVSGVTWVTFGYVLGMFLLLIFPQIREECDYLLKIILNWLREKRPEAVKTQFRTKVFFFLDKLTGLSGTILEKTAISLGPVALVTGLQGVKTIFLLFLAIPFSFFFPQILKEELESRIVFRKILAVIMIGLGVYLLWMS